MFLWNWGKTGRCFFNVALVRSKPQGGSPIKSRKNKRKTMLSWCFSINNNMQQRNMAAFVSQPLTAIWVMRNRLFSRRTPERETEERGSDRTAMECWKQPTAAHNCPLLDDRAGVLGWKIKEKKSKVARKAIIYHRCQFEKWEDYKTARELKTTSF